MSRASALRGRGRGLTAVRGIRVGHATDRRGLTGCTVILCERGALGAVDIRGAATGTREVELLGFHHLAERIHAVLLTGGSAFGLDAAGGVMRYLEERGVGFPTGAGVVPLVPAAVLFDLGLGDPRARPDPAMGYAACRQASAGTVAEGSVGVGTGATVGKLFGLSRAMKGGLGTWSLSGPRALTVAALAVVNAFGDVRAYPSGALLAGTRAGPRSLRLVDSARLLRTGSVRPRFSGEHTTLGVVATDARLTRGELHRVARRASGSVARCLSPAHTALDGDLVIALATGVRPAEPEVVAALGEAAMAEAIMRAIRLADGFGQVPAWRDLPGNRGEGRRRGDVRPGHA